MPKNNEVDEQLLLSLIAEADPRKKMNESIEGSEHRPDEAPDSYSRSISAPKNRGGLADYTMKFVVPTPCKSRVGAYIDKELHRRITAIVGLSGTREVTVGSYIDNVLKEHFKEYEVEVKQYCQKSVNRII